MARTPEQIVEAFVKNHALLDKHLAAAHKVAQKMAKDVEEGIGLGMVRGLEAKSFLAGHRKLPGVVADAALYGSELHKQGTKIAQDNGVDLGSLTTVGGVTIGGVVVMGGGGR